MENGMLLGSLGNHMTLDIMRYGQGEGHSMRQLQVSSICSQAVLHLITRLIPNMQQAACPGQHHVLG